MYQTAYAGWNSSMHSTKIEGPASIQRIRQRPQTCGGGRISYPRAWSPYFYRFLKALPDSDAADAARRGLEEGLKQLTQAAEPVGPFFCGTEAGALDLALAPFSYRILLILTHFRAYHVPRNGPVWEKYHRWTKALHAHPAFLATQSGPDYEQRLTSFYRQYAEGGGQKGVDVIPA